MAGSVFSCPVLHTTQTPREPQTPHCSGAGPGPSVLPQGLAFRAPPKLMMEVAIRPLEQQSSQRQPREPRELAHGPTEPGFKGTEHRTFSVTLSPHLQITSPEVATPSNPETRLPTRQTSYTCRTDVGLMHLIRRQGTLGIFQFCT